MSRIFCCIEKKILCDLPDMRNICTPHHNCYQCNMYLYSINSKCYCTCCVIVSYIILYVFRYKQQSVICISNPNCKLKKNIKKYVQIKSTLTVSFLKLKEFNTMK